MAFTKQCQSSLSLNGLRIPVRVGCGPDERAQTQIVRFDLRVDFASLPLGCHTDSLEDTVCYARMSEEIHRVSTRQEYRLIESLGLQTFAALKELLLPNQTLWLKVTKEKPPIPHLNEGASFVIQDSPLTSDSSSGVG
jgi:dihydroneopterin aldolase